MQVLRPEEALEELGPRPLPPQDGVHPVGEPLLCRRLLSSLGEKAEDRALHVPVGVLESEPRLGHAEAERGDTIESGRRRRGAHGEATVSVRSHARAVLVLGVRLMVGVKRERGWQR